jgi:glycosyltransferase involved in cell wall biosynthesis
MVELMVSNKLSILIPSLTTRFSFLSSLVIKLSSQIEQLNRNDIHINVLMDNRKRTIGEQRNILLDIADGEFLTFIDDDDDISDNYLQSIMFEIDRNSKIDCIVFDCLCTVDKNKPTGGRQFYSKYGIEYEYTKLEPWTTVNCYKRPQVESWFGKPSHTMVWNSKIAKQCRFPSKNVGEDFDWVQQAWPLIKNQIRIPKVLYFYNAVLNKGY